MYDNNRSYAYQYDLAGNRLQEQATVGITTTTTNWTYNDANQISTIQIGSNPLTNFSYDANGNMLSDGQLTYTWDRTNRLVTTNNGAINTHYAYTGDGDRVSQTIGGAVTDYLLDIQPELALVLQESTVSDTLTYLHAPMGIHGVENQAGDWNYHLTDGLGSVRAQVDANPTISATQMYDPYGQAYDVTGTFVGTFGFAGEQMDDSGLSYNRARYYNPALGAFTALDPFEGTKNQPMSLNGYSYAHNNPIMNTDPNGEFAFLAPLAAAATKFVATVAAPVAIGAIGGAIGSLGLNLLARSGQCGCEMKQAAENIDIQQALIQGAIGGVGGALAFLGLSSGVGAPAAGAVLGGIGTGVSVFDMLKNGVNLCNILGAALSAIGGYKLGASGRAKLVNPSNNNTITLSPSSYRTISSSRAPATSGSSLVTTGGSAITSTTGGGSITPYNGVPTGGSLTSPISGSIGGITSGIGGGNPDANFDGNVGDTNEYGLNFKDKGVLNDNPSVTVLGKMPDVGNDIFHSNGDINTWWKSGRIPGRGLPGDGTKRISWAENREWLEFWVKKGTRFALVTPRSELSREYIRGVPNGFGTYQELDHLERVLGVEVEDWSNIIH